MSWCHACVLFPDYDTTDIPPAKRRKLESEEGKKAIAEFLSAVKELASSEDNETELEVKLEKLKLDFLSIDNDYIKSIIGGAVS